MSEDRRSFWTTTAGVLTALGTFLTAATGAVALFLTTRDTDPPPGDPDPPSSERSEPGATRPEPGEPALTLDAWVVDVNALCREASGPIGDLYLGLERDWPMLTAQDPILGEYIHQLAGRYAVLAGQIGSLPAPDEAVAIQWLTLYAQQANQFMSASDLWDAGDVQGAAGMLLTVSQSTDAAELGEELGVICP